MPRDGRDILIGKVTTPFGTRGEVKVVVLTDFPERFAAGARVALKSGEKTSLVRIERSRPHKGGILLKLEGIDTVNAAEELRNTEITIDEADLGKLEGDRFYIFDIIGLKVVTDDGREQGEVVDVLQGSANDVYVTSTGLCIPALKDVVAKVDVPGGVMIIHPVPGLLPDD